MEMNVPEGRPKIARRFSAGFTIRAQAVPEGRLVRMSHTYISSLFHCVFSTRGRRALIPPARQDDLWSYLGGIARKNGFKALAVGGTDDHAHVLVSLPSTISLAKAVQLLKGGSSKWMNESGSHGFAWQEGYGAFSIGISQRSNTIEYIRRQSDHHHKTAFEREYLAFLEKHGIDYDPKYVLG